MGLRLGTLCSLLSVTGPCLERLFIHNKVLYTGKVSTRSSYPTNAIHTGMANHRLNQRLAKYHYLYDEDEATSKHGETSSKPAETDTDDGTGSFVDTEKLANGNFSNNNYPTVAADDRVNSQKYIIVSKEASSPSKPLRSHWVLTWTVCLTQHLLRHGAAILTAVYLIWFLKRKSVQSVPSRVIFLSLALGMYRFTP